VLPSNCPVSVGAVPDLVIGATSESVPITCTVTHKSRHKKDASRLMMLCSYSQTVRLRMQCCREEKSSRKHIEEPFAGVWIAKIRRRLDPVLSSGGSGLTRPSTVRMSPPQFWTDSSECVARDRLLRTHRSRSFACRGLVRACRGAKREEMLCPLEQISKGIVT
jgi:hypothetical protein